MCGTATIDSVVDTVDGLAATRQTHWTTYPRLSAVHRLQQQVDLL